MSDQDGDFCPKCGSGVVEAHVQTVIRAPGRIAKIAVHSIGWHCLKCQHIWGHEGFAREILEH